MEDNKYTVEGKVTETEGNPKPYSFYIEATKFRVPESIDKKDKDFPYFAHLGDIEANVELLYAIERGEIFDKDGNPIDIFDKNGNKVTIASLNKGDEVEFKPIKHREYKTIHAIYVKKKS